MRVETVRLNQTLVLSALEAIEHWETWANTVPRGATKALNLHADELVFTVNSRQSESSHALVALPPSVRDNNNWRLP